MFNKIICSKCNTSYDDANEFCPKCGKENTDNPKAKGTRNISFVSAKKQIALFAVGWVGFQIIGFIMTFIIMISAGLKNGFELEIMLNAVQNIKNSFLINTASYGILFGVLSILMWKDTSIIFKTFNKWLPYVVGVIGFILIIGFEYFYTFILNALKVEIPPNDNQSVIVESVKYSPIISLIIFGFIGPFCEEITYRVGLYSLFRRINKYLAYVLTVFLFALIHFNYASTNIVNELINLPVYLMAAFILTFLYEKYGLAASSTAHILNNVFSVVSILTQG